MEVIGGKVYAKFGVFLAPLSVFCTIFQHLDWQRFAEIAKERKETEETQEEELSTLESMYEENGELPTQNS